MGFKESIRNKFLEAAGEAVDKSVDGREITQKLDAQLDAQVGEKTSEKLQRGPFTNLLLEMTEGLWQEDLGALIPVAEEWTKRLKDAAAKSQAK